MDFYIGQSVVIVKPEHHPELKGVVCTIISIKQCICDPNTGRTRPNCYYDDLYPGSFGHESVYAPLPDDYYRGLEEQAKKCRPKPKKQCVKVR